MFYTNILFIFIIMCVHEIKFEFLSNFLRNKNEYRPA